MGTFRHILVPIDFGEPSKRTIEIAIDSRVSTTRTSRSRFCPEQGYTGSRGQPDPHDLPSSLGRGFEVSRAARTVKGW